jgi:hypothetical protein
LKSALEFDDSLHFDEVYHEYRILSEIPDKLPCFRRHIGLVGGAKAKFCRRFVDNSYTDKFTMAFSQIPIGYDACSSKQIGLRGNFTPSPPDNRRVKLASPTSST